MNIIVIVVDTLRYDFIGANGNDWIKTPNLDRLAQDSWVFENSYNASYPTIPHRTDAMTGRYGSPFYPWRPLRHDAVTLPWTLGEAGYCTQLIHDTPHLVNGGHNFDWPFHAWTFVHGAEVDRPWVDDSRKWLENWAKDELFDSVKQDPMSQPMVATYARANRKRVKNEEWNCAQLFRTASRFLEDNSKRDRFFLWVDCFDPHEPWDAPREFMQMYDDTPGYDGTIDPRSFVERQCGNLSPEAQERVKAAYAAKVSWVDHCLGEMLDTLEKTGLASKTAILLTADHGTRLGEYGGFGKAYPVREQEAHTPFMVRLPGEPGGRSDIIVQPQDIFATVTGLAGVDMPASIDSYDVASCARFGETPPRRLALASRAAAPTWASSHDQVLFSVFDGEWCLEFTARWEECALRRMGETEDVASRHQDVVKRLHAAALDEISLRDIDRKLLDWLRSEGEDDFPEDCVLWDGYPGPAGFAPYFSRTYRGK